jgi:hypothetical protein
MTQVEAERLADMLADELRRPECTDKNVSSFLQDRLSLSVKPPVVKVDLYQPRCLLTEEIQETQLTQEEVDFLTHCMATYGEAVFEFLGSDVAWSPHIRSRCLEILGREFYQQSVYVNRMDHLLKAKESVVQCKRSEDLLIKMSKFTKKLLRCDDAKLWIVHKERKMIWNFDENIDDTVNVPFPHKDAVRRGKAEGIGMLQGVYLSAEELNIDPFNCHFASEDDLRVSKGKRSAFIPILKNDKDDVQEVVAIAEVHSKTKGGKFTKDDTDIMRAFASTCYEVYKICEENDAMAWDETRAQTVMTLAEALMSVHTPELRDPKAPDLMEILHTGFQELFNADMVSVHVVFSSFLGKLTPGDPDEPYSLEYLEPVAMDGLLAMGVAKKKPMSFNSKNKPAKHSETVDLPWGELPSHIYTWPCFYGKVLSCLIQFRCVESAGRPFGDDGAFNEYNAYHHKILQQLIACVMLHMNDRYPMMDRDSIELLPDGVMAYAEGKSPSRHHPKTKNGGEAK